MPEKVQASSLPIPMALALPERHTEGGDAQGDAGGEDHARQPLRPGRLRRDQGEAADHDEPECDFSKQGEFQQEGSSKQ